MAYINITADDGTLVDRLDVNDWDLDGTFARDDLVNEIFEAIERAQMFEEAE